MRTVLAVLLFAGTIAACSFSADADLAEAKVPEFHALLDAGDAHAIYAASADDLKKSVSERDFVAFIDAIHRKLGPVKSMEKPAWQSSHMPGGTFVTLTYKTQFSEGEATERFVYRIVGDQATLAGYNINSLALITK